MVEILLVHWDEIQMVQLYGHMSWHTVSLMNQLPAVSLSQIEKFSEDVSVKAVFLSCENVCHMVTTTC